MIDKTLFLEKYLINNEPQSGQYFWRKTDDPYKIMVAEIMLQRTRADQVKEVYVNFIKKYPDITSLHNANKKDMAKILCSLGLIKRVEYLKQISNILIKKHDGKIPNNKKSILNLPMVGEYTANAIMVHAFYKKYVTYDANAARILDRYFGLGLSSPKQKDPKGYDFAKDFILRFPEETIRKVNLNMIDHGINVCKNKKPNCVKCDLSLFCTYHNKAKGRTKNKYDQSNSCS